MLRFMAGVVGYLAAIAVGFAFYIHISDRHQNSTRTAQFSSPELWKSRLLERGGKFSDPQAIVTGSISPIPPPRRSQAARSASLPAISTASIGDQPVGRRWTIKVVRAPDDEIGQTVTRQLSARAKAQLTRAIQREIKRVGCGRVYATGYWDRRTKTAIAKFVANRNSALPTDGPTDFLLSLLKTYSADDCGRTRSKPSNRQPRLVSTAPVNEAAGVSSENSRTYPPAAVRSASRKTSKPVKAKTRYRDVKPEQSRVGRMALGAQLSKPASPSVVPSVAAGGPTYSGPSDLEANNAAKRSANKQSLQRARKRRAAKRRARRRAQRQAKRSNRSSIKRATVNRAAQVARDRRERWVTRMLSRDLD